MSRGLSTSILNALRGPRTGERWMLRFDFDEGTFGFWAGSYDFSYDGVVYRPGGILELEEISWSDGVAQSIAVGIRSLPDRAIEAAEDVFARIEAIDYVGRPVTYYAAVLDAEGRVVDVLPEWSGRCGPVDHEQDSAKGTVKAVMTLESDSFDHTRKDTSTFSPGLLRAIFPGDAGLDAIAVAATIKIELK